MPIGSALGGFAEGFTKGYDWGEGVRANIAKGKISELEARGPQEKKVAIDAPEAAQQISQLEEQTADFRDDPEVMAAEEALYKDTGRQVFVEKDWDSFRESLARYAGAIPDAEYGRKIDDRINTLQQKGFSENAMKAAVALEEGDIDRAGVLMQKAWGWMPDGSTTRYLRHQDAQGKPILVSWRIDEETGRPVGNPTPVDAEILRGVAESVTDPESFLDRRDALRKEVENTRRWKEEQKLKKRETAAEETRAGAAVTTAEAARTRAAAAMKEASGVGGLKLPTRNNVSSNVRSMYQQHLDGIKLRMETGDDTAWDAGNAELNWFTQNKDRIQSTAEQIALATGDYGGGIPFQTAMVLAQNPGFGLAQADDGSLHVVAPDGQSTVPLQQFMARQGSMSGQVRR